MTRPPFPSDPPDPAAAPTLPSQPAAASAATPAALPAGPLAPAASPALQPATGASPALQPATGARDLPRDEHLRAALRHLPDTSLQPPPHLRAQLLAAAERAVAAAPASTPAAAPARKPGWRAWRPLGLGASGAFASLMLAGVIGLIWRDDLPGPAVDGPAARPAANAGSAAAAPGTLAAEAEPSAARPPAPAAADAAPSPLMRATEHRPGFSSAPPALPTAQHAARPQAADGDAVPTTALAVAPADGARPAAPAADPRLSPTPPAPPSPPASAAPPVPPAPPATPAPPSPPAPPAPGASPKAADPPPEPNEHPDARRLRRQTPAQAAPGGEGPVTAPPSPDPGLPAAEAARPASPSGPSGMASAASTAQADRLASPAPLPGSALAAQLGLAGLAGPAARLSGGAPGASADPASPAVAWRVDGGAPASISPAWLQTARTSSRRLGQPSALRDLPQARQVSLLGLGGQLLAQVWLTPSQLLWCPATGEACRLSPLDAAAASALLQTLPPAAARPDLEKSSADGPAPAAADQPPKRDSR